MSIIVLQRPHPSEQRFELMTAQMLASFIKGKQIKDMHTDVFKSGPPNPRLLITFSDDSVLSIQEIVGESRVYIRFLTKKERGL